MYKFKVNLWGSYDTKVLATSHRDAALKALARIGIALKNCMLVPRANGRLIVTVSDETDDVQFSIKF